MQKAAENKIIMVVLKQTSFSQSLVSVLIKNTSMPLKNSIKIPRTLVAAAIFCLCVCFICFSILKDILAFYCFTAKKSFAQSK